MALNAIVGNRINLRLDEAGFIAFPGTFHDYAVAECDRHAVNGRYDRDARLLEVADLGLARLADGPGLDEPQLDGCVAVLLRRLLLDDGAGPGLEDRDGDNAVDTGETIWQQSENGTNDVPGLLVFTYLE